MRLAIETVTLLTGLAIGVWCATVVLLPLFYGVPKALIGYFRSALYFRAVLAYLVAPVVWMVFFFLISLGLYLFWRGAFEYLLISGSFNFGQTIGTLMLIANVLFSKKARADVNKDFEDFVLPYAKPNPFATTTNVSVREVAAGRLPRGT